MQNVEDAIQNEGSTTYERSSGRTVTVARRQNDGSYARTLYLPTSFSSQSQEEQEAILGHELAHLERHHNERLIALGDFNLDLFGLENGVSPEEALPLFQNGTWSMQEATDSDALRMVSKAQELEADWLALLHSKNPLRIKTGMERILSHEKSDPNHPSKEKRLAWASKIVALLEAEKQLAGKAHQA